MNEDKNHLFKIIFEPVPLSELDTDGDGILNDDDLEDDNDGVSDEDEIANETDPNDPQDTPDLIPPVITLIGSSTLELTLSQVASLNLDSSSEGSATATDNVDGDITSFISISSNLDTTQAGTYEIIYSVSDTAGNSSTTTRTIILIEEIAIYIENGICVCPEAVLGQTKTMNGITYTVVDDTTIANEIANGNSNLCTTAETDMSRDRDAQTNFFNNFSFDSHIRFWDTSNVTSMKYMFFGASEFNMDISGWNVSNVTNFVSMFNGATQFNQNIGEWTPQVPLIPIECFKKQRHLIKILEVGTCQKYGCLQNVFWSIKL